MYGHSTFKSSVSFNLFFLTDLNVRRDKWAISDRQGNEQWAIGVTWRVGNPMSICYVEVAASGVEPPPGSRSLDSSDLGLTSPLTAAPAQAFSPHSKLSQLLTLIFHSHHCHRQLWAIECHSNFDANFHDSVWLFGLSHGGVEAAATARGRQSGNNWWKQRWYAEQRVSCSFPLLLPLHMCHR